MENGATTRAQRAHSNKHKKHFLIYCVFVDLIDLIIAWLDYWFWTVPPVGVLLHRFPSGYPFCMSSWHNCSIHNMQFITWHLIVDTTVVVVNTKLQNVLVAINIKSIFMLVVVNVLFIMLARDIETISFYASQLLFLHRVVHHPIDYHPWRQSPPGVITLWGEK